MSPRISGPYRVLLLGVAILYVVPIAVAAGVPWWLAYAGIALLAAAAMRRGGRKEPLPPLASARWADDGDAAAFVRPGAFLLGLWGPSRTPLYLSEEQLSGHVLVAGPSRTGKTAGVIAPNLLARDPSRESVVVLDVKTGPRSLWNVTAGRYGDRARLFCPLFEGSTGYNPLSRVDSIGAAQRRAALFVHNTTARGLSADAQVYAAATVDLATLLFLHVQQDRRRGGHTLGAVHRLAMEGPAVLRDTLRGSRVPAVREHQGMFAGRERRVQEAAVTGLLERLSPWADPLIVEATSQDADLAALGREPQALYIVMPEADAPRLQPLVACLVADILDELVEQADRGGRRVPVRLFLDEFRQFGHLPGLSDALPTLRERGISVLLGVQVLSQIDEVYGRVEGRTLIGNCETKLLFRAGDLETAGMISAWLGHTAVPAVSVTLRGRRQSTTAHPYVRPLLPAEEATRIPDGAMIALAGAARPLALRQARYYTLPHLAVVPPPFPLRRRPGTGIGELKEDAPSPPRRASPAPRPSGGVPATRPGKGERRGA